MSKTSTQTQALKFITKLETLPHINTELNSLLQEYRCVKHASKFSKFGFWFCERVVKFWFDVCIMLLFSMPEAILASGPVTLLDDFVCHQLDSIEESLSRKTGSVYRTHAGCITKVVKILSIIFRIVFIWPRLTLLMFVAFWDILRDEIKEDLQQLQDVFSKTATKVRRTARMRTKKPFSCSPSQSQRKRKHEENLEEETEEYIFVEESYHSENDPDYEIGQSTCEDEASNSDGETTNDEDDEHDNDSKCFLCEQCKECSIDSEDDKEALEDEKEADGMPGLEKFDIVQAISGEIDAVISGLKEDVTSKKIQSETRAVDEEGKNESSHGFSGQNAKSPVCQKG